MNYLLKAGPIRRIGIAWISALLVILVSVSVAQFVIQTASNSYKHERQVATIIGMQQGRSLRMTQDSYTLLDYPDQGNAAIAEMISLEPTWERLQQASYRGDPTLDIQPNDLSSSVIAEAYKSNIDYVLLRTAFLNIISKKSLNPLADIRADVQVVAAHESKYVGHYVIVFASLAKLADDDVSRLQLIELYVLYPLTPAMLLVEYLVAVRPALRSLQKVSVQKQD